MVGGTNLSAVAGVKARTSPVEQLSKISAEEENRYEDKRAPTHRTAAGGARVARHICAVEMLVFFGGIFFWEV